MYLFYRNKIRYFKKRMTGGRGSGSETHCFSQPWGKTVTTNASATQWNPPASGCQVKKNCGSLFCIAQIDKSCCFPPRAPSWGWDFCVTVLRCFAPGACEGPPPVCAHPWAVWGELWWHSWDPGTTLSRCVAKALSFPPFQLSSLHLPHVTLTFSLSAQPLEMGGFFSGTHTLKTIGRDKAHLPAESPRHHILV